jgi:hypothetical protein
MTPPVYVGLAVTSHSAGIVCTAGVNLKSIKTLYIGAGDPANPAPGGSGTFYVDDIGIGHPVP